MDAVCRMEDLRRKMPPIGTGRAKDIPSSDKNRTCPRVNILALVKPSWSCVNKHDRTGEMNEIPHTPISSNNHRRLSDER